MIVVDQDVKFGDGILEDRHTDVDGVPHGSSDLWYDKTCSIPLCEVTHDPCIFSLASITMKSSYIP